MLTAPSLAIRRGRNPSAIQIPTFDVDYSYTQQAPYGAPSGVLVDDYGAQGDGVTHDDVAINAAATAAGDNGTVLFTPGKTYIIGKGVSSRTGQRWTTAAGTSCATIKRAPERLTTLTADIESGATTLPVTAPDIFPDTGLYVSVAPPPPNSHDQGEVGLIQVVDKDTSNLYLSSGVSRGYSKGDIVVSFFAMVAFRGAFLDHLIFDGNREENDSWLAWEHTQTVYLVAPNDDCVVEHCVFKNGQGDCITPNAATRPNIHHCLFEQSNTSGVHLSNTTNAWIHSNVFRYTNLQAVRAAHAEGGVTWSNQNSYPTVEENVFKGIPVYAMGKLVEGATNTGATIKNNRVEDCEGVFDAKGSASVWTSSHLFDLVFEGNKCRRSRALNMRQDSGWYSGAVINDNVFIDCYLFALGIDDLEIYDNFFVMTNLEYGDPQSYDNKAGLCGIYSGNRIDVHDNYFIGGDKGLFLSSPDYNYADRAVNIDDNVFRDQTLHCMMIGNRYYTWRESPYYVYGDMIQVSITGNDILSMKINDYWVNGHAAVHLGRGQTDDGTVFRKNKVVTNKTALFVEGRSFDETFLGIEVDNNTLIGDVAALKYRSWISRSKDLVITSNALSHAVPSGISSDGDSTVEENAVLPN